jgi:hypothetical protein
VTMGSGGTGVSIPLGAEAFVGGPFSEGGTFQYECNDTTLTAFIPAGVAPFSTSSFRRVSDVPPTPIPDEEVEDGGGVPEVPPLDTTVGGSGTCSDVVADSFVQDGNSIQWSLRNSGTAAVQISAVSLDWPSGNGNWTGIELEGERLWTGSQSSTPARVDSGWSATPAAFTLAAGTESVLVLSFSGSSISPSGYLLVIDLADGCIVHDVH